MKYAFLILLILLTIIPASGWASSRDFKKYIDQYQYIAINEMERTGIPASIKLAQALLESNAGKSVLARKAKNHFGIKCGSKWRGKKYYRKDDDYRRGKLIKSCFRAYKNPESSFLAHSEFLLDNGRYGSLFKLNPTDYKKWAKGLKKAGYATSKTYDKKLIKLIQEYELYRYDQEGTSSRIAKAKHTTKALKQISAINDVKLVYAKEGETANDIAKRTKTSIRRILAYNEALTAPHNTLEKGESVFLQKKRKNYRGKQKVHRVKASETMYDIAQLYGLRLDKLYKKNKMTKGMEPAIGAGIRIRGRNRKRPRLRKSTTSKPPAPVLIADRPKPRSETIEVEAATATTKISNKEKADNITKEKEKMPIITTAIYHTVVKGETLWRISKNYGTTVETIMSMNNLKSKIISVGMKLRVE